MLSYSTRMLKNVASRLLALHGWTLSEPADRPAHAVLIAYPHTSNWDALYALILPSTSRRSPATMSTAPAGTRHLHRPSAGSIDPRPAHAIAGRFRT
ncbi:MAG: hypothetical protein FAZ92_03580 [Accumulibacter sp.]|nr:MAG: hypothetical protein FAZ92_03580 [Accumulibacter sp.]